jgi:hypothetical protein
MLVAALSLPLGMVSLGCSKSSSAPSDCSKDYWVALTGDDAGDGSELRPFRTIDQARKAVRSDPAKGQCTISVNIRSGVYSLTSPLQFDPLDSGSDPYKVVYRSAPGNTQPVVVSGGILVDGFDCSSGICSATVPDWPEGRIARQFYVDDVRAIRARSNYDPTASVQGANPVYARTESGYEVPLGGRAPPLSNPEWAEVVTVTQWKMMRCPLLPIPGVTLFPDPQCWWNANTYPEPWNFQLLSWIENAPEYLDQPGMWFLNPASKTLLYWPYGGTTPSMAVVPRLESLVNIVGQPGSPVSNIRFSGLQFSYATWSGPSTDGYVSDQSGNFVKGPGYSPNLYGHHKIVYSTPGNVNLTHARAITFEKNVFSHLGGVGIWLGTGSQDNLVVDNTFTDISSAAIQVGGVDLRTDVRADAASLTSGNRIVNNDISYTGRDYYDTAAIFVMFAAGTTIRNNTIRHTPWTGIAIGWGWGLLDEGSFPGMPYARYFDWGVYTTPTVVRDNRIVSNRISHFLEQLWDGGAVYVNGSQGTGTENGLLLQLNVVDHKRPSAGGNIFYTDAGSRYVTLDRNVSLANEVGFIDLGSCATPSTWPGPGSAALLRRFGDNEFTRWIIAVLDSLDSLCAVTGLKVSYGAEMGGCVPRGHLTYVDNYFAEPIRFFDICTSNLDVPVAIPDVSIRNRAIQTEADVPSWIIRQAGRH